MNQPTFSRTTEHYAKAANEDPTLFDPYYNTVDMKETELKERRNRCMNQGQQIIDVFRSNPDQLFTPFDVQYHLQMLQLVYPITSIRRCISNLTADGKLIKTDQKHPGVYGDMNYCWKFNQ